MNILLVSMMKLSKADNDLVPTDVSVCRFSGNATRMRGVLPLELKIWSKIKITVFFVVDTSSNYNAFLGRDWIYSNWCVHSSLYQLLLFWNDNNSAEVVYADEKPFIVSTNNVEAQLYDDNIRTIKLVGCNGEGKPIEVTVQKTREDASFIKEEFKDLCRVLAKPNLLEGLVKLGSSDKKEVDN